MVYSFGLRACSVGLFAGLLAYSSAFGVQPTSQTTPPVGFSSAGNPTFATVDVQKVVEGSLAFKKLQDLLNAKMEEYKRGLRSDETRLEKTIKEATSEAQKRKASQEKIRIQAKVNEYSKNLQYAFASAMEKLQTECIRVIEGISQVRGYKVVFPKGTLIWSHSSLDITGEVITLLNQQLKELPMVFSAQPMSAAH